MADQVVAFAPGPRETGTWYLYLPADWSTALRVELHKNGATYRTARMGDPAHWTVPPSHVAAVAELLAREGLRGVDEVMSVDEVLSYLTPREKLRHQIGAANVLAMVERLAALPQEEYDQLYHIAERRARPDVNEAVSALDPDVIRRLFAENNRVAGWLRNAGLGSRPALVELEGILRQRAESADELNDLVQSLPAAEQPEAQALVAALSRERLNALATEVLPRLGRGVGQLTRAILEPLVVEQFVQLPPESQIYWKAALGAEQQQKAEIKAARQTVREEKKAHQEAVRQQYKEHDAKRKETETAIYEKNANLFAFLPHLIGEVVPINNSGGQTVGFGTITATKDRWVRPRTYKGLAMDDMNRHNWWFTIVPVEDVPSGGVFGGGYPATVPITFTTGRTQREHGDLVFSNYDIGVDLKPALQSMLADFLRAETEILTAILPGPLMRYIQAAVAPRR